MYRFVQAIRQKDTVAFKEKLRSADVLLIDDIQFICDKESTQEEFLHTLNALLDHRCQVVVSGDRSPSRLDGMGERLRSRLAGGLAVDILPANYELRLGFCVKRRRRWGSQMHRERCWSSWPGRSRRTCASSRWPSIALPPMPPSWEAR